MDRQTGLKIKELVESEINIYLDFGEKMAFHNSRLYRLLPLLQRKKLIEMDKSEEKMNVWKIEREGLKKFDSWKKQIELFCQQAGGLLK